MTLPPERISIKRRRQDEPVDTLILEPGTARDKKRRFTDFYFQRLRLDQQAGKASQQSDIQSTGTSAAAAPNKAAARNYAGLGIPTIRSSAPGDEVKDFTRYKAEQSNTNAAREREAVNISESQESSLLLTKSAAGTHQREGAVPRRFHLTRDISSLLGARSASTGGIYRSRPSLRPPLATFIEHRPPPQNDDRTIYKNPPVDRIVELKDNNVTGLGDKLLTEDDIDKKTQVSTFLKTSSPSTAKHGNSIRDDPSTWDYDSDQLANELAALAFDIDPADATEPPQVQPKAAVETPAPVSSQPPAETAMVVDGGDDFIFETYVRVKHNPSVSLLQSYNNSEIGVLIIDDENEDLWEKYVQGDDDDDEWNEEDEDSNGEADFHSFEAVLTRIAEDNPRNEYPDDEVSTDDEYGRNAYKYRHNASDDEEFDESREDW